MKRRARTTAIALAGALTVLGGVALAKLCRASPRAPHVDGARRPSVVLVIIDTLRADRVGAYGATLPPGVSPTLDRLAREGVRFARPISQSSWTRPSIGSFLTSRYPRTLGIFVEEEDALADGYLTLAEILQEHGYRTVGLTANPNINTSYNFQQGFDEYVDSHVRWDWMPDVDEGDSHADQPLPPARALFARALQLAREGDHTGPQYLQIDVMDVHEYGDPRAMRAEFTELFPDRPDADYLRMVRQVDTDIAAFETALRETPGFEDAVLVIVSDHGEGLLDHPDVSWGHAHGLHLYESQAWVPWILHHPAGPLGHGVVQRPVRLLDLAPTLLRYLDIEPPSVMEGRDVLPLLADPNADVGLPRHFVIESQFRGRNMLGVYTDGWKYFEHRRGGRGLAAHELHPIGVTENGVRNSQYTRRREDAAPLREALEAFEEAHPAAERARADTALSDEELEQLRAIGYVQ